MPRILRNKLGLERGERMSDAFFICPKCGEALTRSANSLVCPNRHMFDIAKSGYVNLLLSNKPSHGDNKEMLRSRRAFLEKGFYSHLREALFSSLLKYKPCGNTVLLDSGCGEGYYAERLAEAANTSVFGIDISSNAADLAAKRKKLVGVAVASAYRLPVKSLSCDAVTNIFAPFSKDEFERVLKDGGLLFNVIPAEKHLWELKKAIYDNPYENKPSDPALSSFELVENVFTSKKLKLENNEDIKNLLTMTPYFYRTDKKGLERAASLAEIEVSAEFNILIYKKRSNM